MINSQLTFVRFVCALLLFAASSATAKQTPSVRSFFGNNNILSARQFRSFLSLPKTPETLEETLHQLALEAQSTSTAADVRRKRLIPVMIGRAAALKNRVPEVCPSPRVRQSIHILLNAHWQNSELREPLLVLYNTLNLWSAADLRLVPFLAVTAGDQLNHYEGLRAICLLIRDSELSVAKFRKAIRTMEPSLVPYALLHECGLLRERDIIAALGHASTIFADFVSGKYRSLFFDEEFEAPVINLITQLMLAYDKGDGSVDLKRAVAVAKERLRLGKDEDQVRVLRRSFFLRFEQGELDWSAPETWWAAGVRRIVWHPKGRHSCIPYLSVGPE